MINVLAVDFLNSAFFLYFSREKEFSFKFMSDLKNIMQQNDIHKTILCCDTGSSAYRLAIHPGYKGDRRARRESQSDADKAKLSTFFGEVNKFKKLAPMLGIEVASIPSVEADDIASYVAVNAGENYRCAILSSDGDLHQLLRHNAVIQRSYGPKMQLLGQEIPAQVWVNETRFQEVYELTPKQFVEYKAIAGDSGDSIPSPEGLGSGTALKLLRKYGSIDNIEANIDDLDIPRFSSKARESLKNNFQMVRDNIKLVNLLHSEDTFLEIFGIEGLAQLEDIKARIPEPPQLNEEAIQEYLFENGKVQLFNNFEEWVRPFRGR